MGGELDEMTKESFPYGWGAGRRGANKRFRVSKNRIKF
jgi:hypothetical protein